MATYGQYTDDYEYNPETEQVIIVDGFGGYVMPKGLSEQEISQNVQQIGYSEETTYDDLKHNPKFLDTYKRMYQKAEGEDFKGTDQELVDNYMTEFTYINTNSYDFGKTIYNAYQDEDEQSKQDLGYLLDLYDRTAAFGEGSRSFFSQVRDIGWGLITDPLIVGTLGTGIVYKTALQKIATEGIKAGIKRGTTTLAKHPMKTIGTTGAVAGASWDTAYQDLKLETGITQKKAELGVLKDIIGRPVEEEDVGIDPLEVMFVTAVSAGGGMALGKAGQLVARKISKLRKPDPAKYDNMSREELDAEILRRGIEDPIASKDKEIEAIDISDKNKGDTIPWVNSDGNKINVVVGNTLSKLDAKVDYLKEQSIIDHVEGNQALQGTITKRSENEIEITFDDGVKKIIKNPEEALLSGELLPPMKRTIYDWDSLGPDKDTKLNELNELITNKLKEQELLLDVTPVTNQRRQQKAIADIERKFAEHPDNNVKPLEKAGDIPQINLLDKEGNIIERVNISAGNTISKKYEDILPDDVVRQRLVEYDVMERNINKYMTKQGGRAKEFIKRYMTSSYGLPPEAKNRLEQSVQRLSGLSTEANGLIKKLERVWQLGSGTKLDNASNEVHKALKQALIDDRVFTQVDDGFALTSTNKHGKVISEAFTNGNEQVLKDVITEMRENLKNMSEELLNSGAIKKGTPLYKTIQESIRDKNYIHQQYLFHELNQNLSLEGLATKLFGETIEVEKGVRINSLTYLLNRIKEDYDLVSDDEARVVLNLIATQSKTDITKYSQFLQKRLKDKVIKEVLGDVTDPRAVYHNTLLKTHKFVEDFKLKKDIVQIAIKEGRAFPQAQRKGMPSVLNQWEKLESKKDFSLSVQEVDNIIQERFEKSFENPLESIMVDPFFLQAFNLARGVYHRTADNLALKTVYGLTNMFQVNKLLLSPTTHMRALGGGLLNNTGNAVVPLPSSAWRYLFNLKTPAGERPSIFKRLVPFSDRMKIGDRLTTDDYAAIARLKELNIIHGGARSGLIRSTREFWKGSTPMDTLEQKFFSKPKKFIEAPIERTGKTIEKGVDALSETYSGWDDFNRIKAFEFEYWALEKSFGSGADTDSLVKIAKRINVPNAERILEEKGVSTLIEEVAAGKVSMYSPSYNKLPMIAQQLRSVFIGNFISHPIEMVRNYKNSLKLAYLEMTFPSKGQKVRGLARGAAALGHAGMTLGLPSAMFYSVYNINQKEQKALESDKMNSWFEYGFQKIILSTIKEGKYMTANTGYLDGLSVLGRPARVFINKLLQHETISEYDPEFDKQLNDASMEALKIFLQQYIQPTASAEAIANVYKIIDESLSGRIASEEDYKTLLRNFEQILEPSFVNDLQRAANQSGYKLWPWDKATGKLRTGRKVEHPLIPLMSWMTGLRPKEESVFENIGFGISKQHRALQTTRTPYHNLFKQDTGIIIEGTKLTEEQKDTVRQTFRDMYEEQHKVSKELYDSYGVYNSIASEKNFGKKKFKDKDKIFKNLMTSNLFSGPDTQTGSATYKGTFKEQYADHIMNGESVLSIPVIFTDAGLARFNLLRDVAGNSFIETLRNDFNRLYVRSLEGEEE